MEHIGDGQLPAQLEWYRVERVQSWDEVRQYAAAFLVAGQDGLQGVVGKAPVQYQIDRRGRIRRT